MNLYDLIVVLLIILAAYRGYRVGLAGRLLGWLAAAVALLLASRYADPVSDWLVHRYEMSSLAANLLAYAGVIVGAAAAVLVLGRLLTRVIGRLPVAGRADRLGGTLAGILVALVGVALLTAVLVQAPSSRASFVRTVRRSQTAEIMRSLSPTWEGRMKSHLLGATLGGMRED